MVLSIPCLRVDITVLIEKVRLLEKHISYLVRRHDCVVVPGLGAFLCQYYSACFDENGVSILPPGKKLAFNRWLSDDDGLLCSSVAEANSIPFSDAAGIIRREVEDIHDRLSEGESVTFGNLGTFFTESSSCEILFKCNDNLSGINGALFGLLPVTLSPLPDSQNQKILRGASSDGVENSDEDEENSRRIAWFPPQWRAYASGIVAALAVFVTLIFFVMSPIRVDKYTHSASIAPINSVVQEQDVSSGDVLAEDIAPIVVEPSHLLSDVSDDTVETITEVISDSDVVAENDATMTIDEAGSSVTDIRFSADDPYIVVVASFPTMSQAEIYMNDKGNMRLGVEHMDGRFRVYAATGNNYSTASKMIEFVGQADAWICRK